MDVSGTKLFQLVLLRWLDIVGTVLFLGSAALRQLTFLPAIQTIRDRERRSALLTNEDAHLIPLIRFLLLCLISLHFVSLVYQAGMMSGWELPTLGLNILVILRKTHFGRIWVVKAMLLSALLILLRLRTPWKGHLLLGMGCLLCLLGSMMSGHAIASEAHFIILTDWLHYTAVSVWAGGLLPLRGMAQRSHQLITAASDQAAFLSRIVEMFSVWAVLCVMTIIITGSFNATVYLGHRGVVTELDYGKVLLLKLCFVLISFGLGGFSRFYILPGLRKCEKVVPERERVATLEKLFHHAVTIEIGAVMVVLVLAAFLTQTPPPQP